MLLDALLNRVYDEHPAVPEMMALRALSDSLREFCTRTYAWQAQIADVAVVAGTAEYTLAPPAGTQMIVPLVVRVDGVRIHPSSAEVHRRGRLLPPAGTPLAYLQVSTSKLEFDRQPVAGAVMSVYAALTLQLDDTATSIPTELLSTHAEAIAAGAKMRLTRMAGQPWTDPAAAGAYAVNYYTAVNVAKRDVMSSLGMAEMQVEMRDW